jgi:tryptophan synthase alpha chain
VNNRIDSRFAQLAASDRSALIPFITVGDPHPDWTLAIMQALVHAGADMLELGVPFSDPTADGPVIQQSSERAIEKGVSVQTVLDTVRSFRESDQGTPVILMGYTNPVERFGYDEFIEAAADAGVDGVLMVDCPPEESESLSRSLGSHGIHQIFLVAPTTTPERRKMIAEISGGYIYYVSFKGITGADRLDQAGLAEPVTELKAMSDVPVAVGFGIKDAVSASAVAGFSDGVVIGSALVSTLQEAESADDAARRANAFLAPIREAMDNTRS